MLRDDQLQQQAPGQGVQGRHRDAADSDEAPEVHHPPKRKMPPPSGEGQGSMPPPSAEATRSHLQRQRETPSREGSSTIFSITATPNTSGDQTASSSLDFPSSQDQSPVSKQPSPPAEEPRAEPPTTRPEDPRHGKQQARGRAAAMLEGITNQTEAYLSAARQQPNRNSRTIPFVLLWVLLFTSWKKMKNL